MTDDLEEKPILKAGIDINVRFPGLAAITTGLSQVLSNSIAAIASGIGRQLLPSHLIKLAKAEREIALIRAQTLVDIARIGSDAIVQVQEPYSAITQRAMMRLISEAAEKQTNRELLLDEAIVDVQQSLPLIDAQKDIAVDWLARFWKAAEDVSDDGVRKFLALLLSNEIKQPGSISAQTLALLPNFDSDLAKKFQHFCCLSIDDGENVFVIHPKVFAFMTIGPLDDFGVTFEDLLEFDGCGLIRSAEALMINYGPSPEDPATVDYAGRKALMAIGGKQLQLLHLTRAGREIRRLLSLEPLPAYTEALGRFGDGFLILR